MASQWLAHIIFEHPSVTSSMSWDVVFPSDLIYRLGAINDSDTRMMLGTKSLLSRKMIRGDNFGDA